LEFRDGLATGRLLDPVIRPRGGLARLDRRVDGQVTPEKLVKDLGFVSNPDLLNEAVFSTKRSFPSTTRPLVIFDELKRIKQLSVRRSLTGKCILLIGVTGFIGKVWLTKILNDVPEIGKIYLLIRRARSTTAQRRFERIVEESPVFEAFHERYGEDLPRFLGDRIEVVEGDVTRPGLGFDADTLKRLAGELDLVVNSSGLTDFNPDLRAAVSTNVDATLHLLDFIRTCDHAGLLHLSTCYVVGSRDGRIAEDLKVNYTPAGVAGFDAEAEHDALHSAIRRLEAQAEGEEVTAKLTRQILAKSDDKDLSPSVLES